MRHSSVRVALHQSWIRLPRDAARGSAARGLLLSLEAVRLRIPTGLTGTPIREAVRADESPLKESRALGRHEVGGAVLMRAGGVLRERPFAQELLHVIGNMRERGSNFAEFAEKATFMSQM